MLESTIDIASSPIAQTGLDAQTMAAGQVVAQQLATSEWLGPLAPIALSPFFGLTALSGIATYGPEWLQERSALFGDTSALNNPILFWTMLTLAVLTSLPRFTKVSKPLALAVENIEAYSAIIILCVVRFVGIGSTEQVATPELTAAAPIFLSAGIASLPIDFVMAIVAGINVIVINGVKLFFEFMVWLVPFPTVDAMLEAGNKTVCAGLIALYSYSPMLATVVNLLVLGVCLLVFGWTYRRLIYYREIIAGPMLAWLLPGWFKQKGTTIRAFPEDSIGSYPAVGLARITKVADRHYQVRGRWLWKRLELDLADCSVEFEAGLVAQKVTLISAEGERFAFNHRRWVRTDECYEPNESGPQFASA